MLNRNILFFFAVLHAISIFAIENNSAKQENALEFFLKNSNNSSLNIVLAEEISGEIEETLFFLSNFGENHISIIGRSYENAAIRVLSGCSVPMGYSHFFFFPRKKHSHRRTLTIGTIPSSSTGARRDHHLEIKDENGKILFSRKISHSGLIELIKTGQSRIAPPILENIPWNEEQKLLSKSIDKRNKQ